MKMFAELSYDEQKEYCLKMQRDYIAVSDVLYKAGIITKFGLMGGLSVYVNATSLKEMKKLERKIIKLFPHATFRDRKFNNHDGSYDYMKACDRPNIIIIYSETKL